MPIYEYQCSKCGGKFEVLQGIADPEIKRCKFCKGPVSKLMSLTSFQLKGSGWYVTDYGGKKPAAQETAANETASSTAEKATAEGSKSSSEKTE
jgi:putative FmdB family regulatory protein